MDDAQNIKGTVKSIRKDKTAVCLTLEEGDVWFDLGEKIKPEYIISGAPFEGKAMNNPDSESGNPVLIFITCSKTAKKAFGSFGKNFSKPEKSEPEKSEYDNSIKRMSAVKAASQVYSGTGKENEFKQLTEDVIEFIDKGIWTVRP